MKQYFIFLIILPILVFISSCGSSKTPEPRYKETVSDIEIVIPCSNMENQSNSEFFRANQSSESTNLNFSREKALLASKQRLSSLISTTIKSVTDRYAQERQIDNTFEFSEKFENLTREVVKEKLSEVKIICEKVLKNESGTYSAFITTEVSKDIIYNGVSNKISKSEKLRQDYDKQKFEAIFNEEMEKLENSNNN